MQKKADSIDDFGINVMAWAVAAKGTQWQMGETGRRGTHTLLLDIIAKDDETHPLTSETNRRAPRTLSAASPPTEPSLSRQEACVGI